MKTQKTSKTGNQEPLAQAKFSQFNLFQISL
jgi:hypothetical protein